MQQITLTEYTESYAVSIEDGLPDCGRSVFFKTKKGQAFEGEYFPETLGLYPTHFDNMQGQDFEPEEIESWHPCTVDM